MQLQHRTAPTAEVVGGGGEGVPRAFCARGQTEDRRLSELRENDLKPSKRRKEEERKVKADGRGQPAASLWEVEKEEGGK